MQSTLNTAALPTIRPKIGRPPAPLLKPVTPAPRPAPVEAPPAATTAGGQSARHFDARMLLLSVCLVLAITLVLSRVISPSMHQGAVLSIPPIPPLAEQGAAFSLPSPPGRAATPQDGVAGTLSAPPAPDEAESYSAGPESPIDNKDHERLLSILSKD